MEEVWGWQWGRALRSEGVRAPSVVPGLGSYRLGGWGGSCWALYFPRYQCLIS